MPTQITNYQCPACTGPLQFSGASGKLECEYCGSSYDVAQIEALYAEKNAQAASASVPEAGDGAESRDAGFSQTWDASSGEMKSYSCPSCGAELICDATTAATLYSVVT